MIDGKRKPQTKMSIDADGRRQRTHLELREPRNLDSRRMWTSERRTPEKTGDRRPEARWTSKVKLSCWWLFCSKGLHISTTLLHSLDSWPRTTTYLRWLNCSEGLRLPAWIEHCTDLDVEYFQTCPLGFPPLPLFAS
jgi:hypothetical protein